MPDQVKNQQTNYPSIFNDVIGPVMRGPSASHCTGALRIGRLAGDLMNRDIKDVLIEFDSTGSLATTHESQGSDMGLFAGLLGFEATDERLPDAPRLIAEAGIKIDIQIHNLDAAHPNTYQITLRNAREQFKIRAISTGGGMIEITQINQISLSIAGDFFETLIFVRSKGKQIHDFLNDHAEADAINFIDADRTQIVQLKGPQFLSPELQSALHKKFAIQTIKQLHPVLPVLSRKNIRVPFITCAEMLQFNADKNLSLWELAVTYECARGNLTEDQVLQKMRDIVDIIEASVQQGIDGTDYRDRILGHQSGKFKHKMDAGQLLGSNLLNRMTLYISALMEMKSAMGVIVAAPTAGSCGAVPGACLAAGNELNLSGDDIAKAMLAAGLIGVFIAAKSTFAAEVCGCQAECGAGSGMAAAALVTLQNGSAEQALTAVSLALQNILGMICDPVANRVEVPCLGKNVMAAANALTCANMALAGYNPVIPPDEVIETMDVVGKSIPFELRCTALGGLSVTQTSKNIEKKLLKKHK